MDRRAQNTAAHRNATTQTRGTRMTRRLITTLLSAAACAVVPTALTFASAAQAQSVSEPKQQVVLSTGRGELVSVPGRMSDIFVANDEIADVQVKSQHQVYVFGKSAGETTVYASDASGNVIWSANLRVGSNIDSIDQMLNMAMPDAKVSVSTMGTNTVLLTGTIAAPEDGAEVERLVQAFLGDKANIISRLKMSTPLQVNLQVKFAEVSRSLVRALGSNLTSMDGSSGLQAGIGQGRQGWSPNFYVGPNQTLGVGNSPNIQVPDFSKQPDAFGNYPTKNGTGSGIIPISPGTTLGIAGHFLGLDLLGALDLAERQGLVTTLSQPNLTALSGETADFLAGGEFPIPMSQGLGSTSIQYKKFGVSLSYTPTVLANGRISMRVRPEVSELSSQGAVTLNGFQVPALTVRRAETTIELGSGQSFMIAGLMSNNAQNTIDKTPGAGDLPILGNLFKSTEFRKGQTELVIIVTPYLVNPVDANDIKLPTDGFRAPTAFQQFFGNAESDGESGKDRPMPRAAPSEDQQPKVGSLDQPAALPSPDNDRKSKKARKEERRAEVTSAPVPGFSLK